MQNRYAGDIGDFGKLGLLRAIAETGLRIGVNWYLVPDEKHNGNGRFTGYLRDEAFCNCDPPLWDALRHIIDGNNRTVHALESASILDAVYYSKSLDYACLAKAERQIRRKQWHSEAIEQLGECDVIFVDPDNGLLVPSAAGTPSDVKYAFPDELMEYYRHGKTVIYYQHKARKKDFFYCDQHRRLFMTNCDMPGLGLKFTRTSLRYYFFLLCPEHERILTECVRKMLSSPWKDCFHMVEL